MKVNLHIPKNKQFRSFYLFFIMVSIQVGVSILGTPRTIFTKAGHDAWISIILAYFYILLLLLTMLYILRQYDNTDILGVQTDLFGHIISRIIGTVFLLFFAIQTLVTLIIYIEVIKVFIFPGSNSFVIGTMLIILALYALIGGIHTIIGVTFLFSVFSYWIIFLLFAPIKQMDFLNFLPLMDQGISDILRGTAATANTFLGFEILFFIYPFVRNKEKAVKPVILGFSFVAFLVLSFTVIATGFLSDEQLERRIWPVLNLYKIQTSPIIERLDYIVVTEWMMIAVPRVILLIWCITYIAKRIYNIPRQVSTYLTAGILLCLLSFFTEHFTIQMLYEKIAQAAIWLVYIYPFLLLPFVIIKKKRREKQKGGQNHPKS